jgi:hypothetical protein
MLSFSWRIRARWRGPAATGPVQLRLESFSIREAGQGRICSQGQRVLVFPGEAFNTFWRSRKLVTNL